MECRILPVSEISARDEALWGDLASHALQPDPMFEPQCLIPASRHLVNRDQILLAIVEEGECFYACMPVTTVAGVDVTVAKVPILRRRATTTQVRRLRYDGTPLVRGERGLEAISVLLRALHERARLHGGILVLEAMRDDGPVADLISAAARNLHMTERTYRTWPRPIVRRRDDMTYRDQHNGETLRTNAKHRRRLERELGGEVQLVDLSGDSGALEHLMQVEASGYKGKLGVDLLSHPGEPEWLRDMCARFHADGRLLLYGLKGGDTVVAMQLFVRGGAGLFSLYAVYDETFSKCSPGIQLHFEVIDAFHQRTDVDWMDSCTGADNKTFLWIYPDRVQASTKLVAVGNAVDQVYVRFYMVALALFGVGSDFRRRHQRYDAIVDRLTKMLTASRK